MPFTQPWFDVDFGSGYTGLGTVGYRLYQNDGTDSVARTTSGVVDISGNGTYGVASVSVPDNAAGIEWDTGGGTPTYAVEDMEPYRDRMNLDAAITTRSTQADILNDATPFAGANIDTTISSRSSHTAADVDTTLSGSHGSGSWEGDSAATIDTLLSTNHGSGSWEGDSAAAIDALLSANHGSGGWGGGGGPDWTWAEKDQIRAALGIDGSKATPKDGLLQIFSKRLKELGIRVPDKLDEMLESLKSQHDHTVGVIDNMSSHLDSRFDTTVEMLDTMPDEVSGCTGLTQDRAARLDNLDEPISTRSNHTPSDIAEQIKIIRMDEKVETWTDAERQQIRDALGIDGDKATAAEGQLQRVAENAEITARGDTAIDV